MTFLDQNEEWSSHSSQIEETEGFGNVHQEVIVIVIGQALQAHSRMSRVHSLNIRLTLITCSGQLNMSGSIM